MSKVLALDQTGRQVAIPLRTVEGVESVVTRIRIRMETLRGTYRADTTFGTRLLSWGPTTPTVEIEADIRQQVRRVRGVVSVQRVTVSRLGDALAISVRAIVTDPDSPEGTAVVVVGGTPEDRTPPGAWYIIIQDAP